MPGDAVRTGSDENESYCINKWRIFAVKRTMTPKRSMRRIEESQMAFRKVEGTEGTSLWPEVYDPETKIRIEYTTRDMPKNPAQMHVMISRNESLIFSFDVVEDTVTHEDARGYTTSYTGSLNKVLEGFRRGRHVFPEFSSEDAVVSYLSEGAGLLFTRERMVALVGAKYVFRLI